MDDSAGPAGTASVNILRALRAKAIALKALLAGPAQAETFQGWPPMQVANVLNQITRETAKAVPELENILPPAVERAGGNDDVAEASYFTLLVLRTYSPS